MKDRAHLHLGLLAAVTVALASWALAWMCDDAFISIRYADHLVRGEGLVFNPGERVEGYSNFLWTLWCAAGLMAGAAIDLWCHAGSIAAAVLTAVLLVVLHRRHRAAGSLSVPIAAIGLAVHRDFLVHATSGLETAWFTGLVLGAFVVLTGKGVATGERIETRQAFLAGLLLGLAALVRPDAPLVALACGLFTLWRARSPIVAGAAIFGGFAVFWAPHLMFRWSYYGALVPNTALAKSAHLPWWSQGLTYIGLYLQRYPVLLLGPGLLALRCVRGGKQACTERPDLVLAAGIALLHGIYVARVGGDFMFARFMLPTTPLLLWMLEAELGLAQRETPSAWFQPVAALALVLATILAPSPVSGTQLVAGIADEHGFYTERPPELQGKSAAELTAEMGAAVRPFLQGVPASVLVIGSQARLAWESRATTVIEANGLTDKVIASQPLQKRGRPGHEKHPTYDYIIRQRGVHLAFSQAAMALVRGRLPTMAVRLGQVQALVLTWDREVMAALSERGAQVPDYDGMLDRLVTQLPQMSTATAQRAWQQHHDFYFRHNDDHRRRAAFDARLGR